jgi:hypothetical protein
MEAVAPFSLTVFFTVRAAGSDNGIGPADPDVEIKLPLGA